MNFNTNWDKIGNYWIMFLCFSFSSPYTVETKDVPKVSSPLKNKLSVIRKCERIWMYISYLYIHLQQTSIKWHRYVSKCMCSYFRNFKIFYFFFWIAKWTFICIINFYHTVLRLMQAAFEILFFKYPQNKKKSTKTRKTLHSLYIMENVENPYYNNSRVI